MRQDNVNSLPTHYLQALYIWSSTKSETDNCYLHDIRHQILGPITYFICTRTRARHTRSISGSITRARKFCNLEFQSATVSNSCSPLTHATNFHRLIKSSVYDAVATWFNYANLPLCNPQQKENEEEAALWREPKIPNRTHRLCNTEGSLIAKMPRTATDTEHTAS